jgi:hypothetical protein
MFVSYRKSMGRGRVEHRRPLIMQRFSQIDCNVISLKRSISSIFSRPFLFFPTCSGHKSDHTVRSAVYEIQASLPQTAYPTRNHKPSMLLTWRWKDGRSQMNTCLLTMASLARIRGTGSYPLWPEELGPMNQPQEHSVMRSAPIGA